jgi:hypothetical protein
MIFWLLLSASPLQIAGCADAEEIQRIAALETRTSSVAAAIGCAGDVATIRVGSRIRLVDLAPIDPRARARLLALTLGELKSADLELSFAPPPAPPRPPELPPAAPLSPPEPGLEWGAGVELVMLRFTAPSPTAFGARASARLLSGSRLGGRADVEALHGGGAVPLGSASVLTVDAGLAAVGAFSIGDFELEVAAGARLGLARLRGEPDDPQAAAGETVSGAFGGPFIGSRLGWPLGPVGISLGVEAGLVALPVIGRAQDRAVIAADGAWISAQAGINFGR